MQLFMNLSEESQQLDQAPFPLKLDFHAPKGRYKIIHQALILPDLNAPLHYFNFSTLIGQPNVPMLRNDSAIQTTALDTVSTLATISPHMVGHAHHYSLEKDCQLRDDYYQFADEALLTGQVPKFKLNRKDDELSFDFDIELQPLMSQFSKLRIGLFDHWSLMCHCQGQLKYKDQHYEIDQFGAFEYARSVNVPYLPLHFFTYQVINLSNQRQLLLSHIRNGFNQIVQSRLYLKNFSQSTVELFDDYVYFRVHRVYPKVTTPNGQEMYLPRMFEWCFETNKKKIIIQCESRGDFKFGLAAGFVGSFSYQVQIDDETEEGSSGYCEYIDCRPLKWQEKDETEKLQQQIMQIAPCALKK